MNNAFYRVIRIFIVRNEVVVYPQQGKSPKRAMVNHKQCCVRSWVRHVKFEFCRAQSANREVRILNKNVFLREEEKLFSSNNLKIEIHDNRLRSHKTDSDEYWIIKLLINTTLATQYTSLLLPVKQN